MAADVRAWMTAYDADGDGLPERDRPRVTGYDLDILSYWYFDGTRLDLQRRAAGAGARRLRQLRVRQRRSAVAELATRRRRSGAGRRSSPASPNASAPRRSPISWDDDTHFFYPQRAGDDLRAPIRELHGFFPFTTLLAPDEPRYTAGARSARRPERVLGALPAGHHQLNALPARGPGTWTG